MNTNTSTSSKKSNPNANTANHSPELTKSATRNFYAVKANKNGEVIPYAFDKIADRNGWIERHDARPTSALEVYKMLNKKSNDIVIANRNHRLKVVSATDANIDPEKGHRIVFG